VFTAAYQETAMKGGTSYIGMRTMWNKVSMAR